MNFTYENQGTNTYLVYTVQPDDFVDTMSLGMLTNNKITGLAPTLFMQMDTTKYIKYNVSAKISVRQFFNGPVNKKRLLGVFKGIVEAMLSAEDYMIDMNSIVLDLDYIFADVSTCETVLVCLPVMGELGPNVNLGNFFKNIMFSTQFDQTENCDHVAKIINYLNSAPVFSLADFKDVLESINNITPSVKTIPQPVVTATVPEPQVKVEHAYAVQKAEAYQQPSVPVKTPSVGQEMVRPVKTPETVVVPTPQAVVDTNQNAEKEISLLYLLRNYNKENVAAYKAQKEAQKGQKSFTDTKVDTKPSKSSKKDAKKKETSKQGFAVPGQASAFAIPGQQPSVQQASLQATLAQFNVPSGQEQHAPTQRPAQQTPQQQMQPSAAVVGGFQQAIAPQGHSMNFGETTVLSGGGIGETTVLTTSMLKQQTIQPHIIRAKNNEKVMVDKPVFRIGKERSYVDYFIGDNSGISRSHANIITREGKYFVVDTNSTNHTFVNGTIIQSNVEVEINHGDKLRFANEDFEFKLY